MTYNKSSEHYKNLEKARIAATKTLACQFCSVERTLGNIKKHESSCWKNPANHKSCIVCENPIKNYKTSVTCGYACANTHFRTGRAAPRWRESTYRTTCFEYHEKRCIICGEENIVAVHHADENPKNNDPSNLVPMCPTHHQYYHSRFRAQVEDRIISYIAAWKEKNGLAGKI